MNKKVTLYSFLGLVFLFPLLRPSLLSGQTDAAPVVGTITAERSAVTGEALLIVETREVTREPVIENDIHREENLKQYCENLLFRILAEDADTGDLPEAGFTVKTNNLNLEKLLAVNSVKGEGKKYVLSFLKEAKSGYIKERILRELSEKEGEPDNNTLDALYAVIKDKSSQVRYLTVRLLGEKGGKNAIPKISSLLYDSYTLRKDVYPVRLAAKEAIELIKMREETSALTSREDAANQWIQIIKDRSVARQDYFCEKAARELAFIPEARELLFKELSAPQLKKTLVSNKTMGYFLLAFSFHKDERALPFIESALSDPSLMNIAAKAFNNISAEKGLESLLLAPIESEKARLLYESLKEALVKEKSVIYNLESREPREEQEALVIRILLLERDIRAYRDAAEVYFYGGNDYRKALFYLDLFEKAGGEESTDTTRELKARCLAALGEIEAASRLSFVLDFSQYSLSNKLLGMLSKKGKEAKVYYYRAEAYCDMKAYKLAKNEYLEAEKQNSGSEGEGIAPEKLKQKIAFCESKIKEQIEDISSVLTKESEQGLSLQISAEKQEYKIGEKIAVKMLFMNNGKSVVYGVNDTEGNLGFDLIVMKKGSFLKRLKKDLTKTIGVDELKTSMFSIEPGNGLSAELTALASEENTEDQEIELFLSYAGGSSISGKEKGWIKQPVTSSGIKIKITR